MSSTETKSHTQRLSSQCNITFTEATSHPQGIQDDPYISTIGTKSQTQRLTSHPQRQHHIHRWTSHPHPQRLFLIHRSYNMIPTSHTQRLPSHPQRQNHIHKCFTSHPRGYLSSTEATYSQMLLIHRGYKMIPTSLPQRQNLIHRVVPVLSHLQRQHHIHRG